MHKTFSTTASFRHTQTSRISVWISTMVTIKSFMLQWMLGTSTVQSSPMTPSMLCGMNKLCHWIFHLLSLILTMCFYFCFFFVCWVLVACFVMFRVYLFIYFVYCHHCWDSYADSWCLCVSNVFRSTKDFVHNMFLKFFSSKLNI